MRTGEISFSCLVCSVRRFVLAVLQVFIASCEGGPTGSVGNLWNTWRTPYSLPNRAEDEGSERLVSAVNGRRRSVSPPLTAGVLTRPQGESFIHHVPSGTIHLASRPRRASLSIVLIEVLE